MLKLGVVTDLHFGPQATFRGKLRKLSHLAPELATAFATRMREEVRPDLVVNLGDAIEDETPDLDRRRYRACLDTLRGSGVELVNVAGNHDYYNLGPEEIVAAWGRRGPLFYSLDRGGVHLVVLYTRHISGVKVVVDDDQLAWLARDLEASPLPAVVLMHHPAADQDLRGNRWFEGLPHICLVDNRVRLREIIARHRRTLLVMNGHAHENHLAIHDGVPYVTLQSLIENLDDDAPGRAAAAHAVVTIEPPYVDVRIEGAETARYRFDSSARQRLHS